MGHVSPIAEPVGSVNAKHYTAKGDGVTDDTAALQAALDAAETTSAIVYLPRGTYMISDTLYVPNKVVMMGVGRTDAGITASSSFPTDGRPMVRLGRTTDSLVFGSRVELCQLNCNSRAAVGVYSTAANEQSGVRFCVIEGFTQYGIHFNTASIITIENVEVSPQVAGATSAIYLQSVAGDNLVLRATLGVSGPLTNGLHVYATQCIAQSIHAENCTNGVNLDVNSTAALIGVSGPTGFSNVTNLVHAQGSTRYSVALNLVKNGATNIVQDDFWGLTYTDAYLPLWTAGDVTLGGLLRFNREHVPAQITTDQDNYALNASAQVVLLDSSGAVNITGFTGGTNGRVIWISNKGANNITLKHETTSTTTNRIIGYANADTVIAAGKGVWMHYSQTSQRWRVMSAP